LKTKTRSKIMLKFWKRQNPHLNLVLTSVSET